jgi:DnaA N-terminal domain
MIQRIRTIKPELFRHEDLFDLESETRLPIRVSWMGLFTCCDREGRFQWRPRVLKCMILPYDEVDFSRVLDALASRAFVVRYTVGSESYGYIPSFGRHQVINNREAESDLPSPGQTPLPLQQLDASATREPRVTGAQSTPLECAQVEGKGMERNGTEGKDLSPADASAEANGFHTETNGIQKLPDPRFQPLVDSFHKHYPVVNEGQKCPWSKREGNQAKLLLSALDPKTWTSAKLDRCVQFRLMSLNKPASEPPAAYMIHLPKYFEAPLDEYGKPDFRRADRWIATHEKPPDDGPAPPKPPRVFAPDPALAELLDRLTNPWIPILGELKGRVNAHSFDTWLKPTSFAGVDARTIVVQVPTAEFRHIGDKWGSLITQAIEKLRMPFKGVEFWHQ